MRSRIRYMHCTNTCWNVERRQQVQITNSVLSLRRTACRRHHSYVLGPKSWSAAGRDASIPIVSTSTRTSMNTPHDFFAFALPYDLSSRAASYASALPPYEIHLCAAIMIAIIKSVLTTVVTLVSLLAASRRQSNPMAPLQGVPV